MPPATPPSGLQAAFLEHRAQLLRFLLARGAGEAAEDALHEVWIRITTGATGPVSSPRAYLHSVANTVMIDRYRSQRQAGLRDQAWSDIHNDYDGSSSDPSAERQLFANQEVAQVLAILDALGPRVATTFRLHRIDGIAQKLVAHELGVSLSTVESDLRVAYRALATWKSRVGEEA